MRYLRNVVTLALDDERCTGCLRCLEVCPRGVLARAATRVAIVDTDACIECGACAANCAVAAISVRTGGGCAAAVVRGWLRGRQPACACGADAAGDDCCGGGSRGASGCCGP
jgi:NAD-dependent dihydropyrimidine dehydrogenase PreA subunit